MSKKNLVPSPTRRKVRVYALDPGLAAQFGTAAIGEMTISLPWEDDLRPGPVGEYVEVVDADPASNVFYLPVDLNDHRLLAQDGLAPSETNPQFHQQMVYAVAMATIGHFERALGRVALWSSHPLIDNDGRFVSEQFVRRLRIYPHAVRERNAYYSPQKKALLFGYFPAGNTDKLNTRGSIIYTSLSHDIIAHETTHALLDGVHPRFNEPFNRDVLAFHEAFADIVALFQHFSYPGVLQHQIVQTRGNLAEENLLAQLAQQFGEAAGRGGALRDALGGIDKDTKKWEPRKADVHALDRLVEVHDRGAVLVAAVFGAFLKVYRSRTADLYRIASDGTGVLRPGDLHPDLSNRLAEEAVRCANYILQMCIRALDYCPPVGITFGDYLRALVTGDFDINPDDPQGYRLAIVDSFRQWGIHPAGMRSMSVEALLWPTGESATEEAGINIEPLDMQSLFVEAQIVSPLKKDASLLALRPWTLEGDRFHVWKGVNDNAAALWGWLMGKGRKYLPIFGLCVDDEDVPLTAFRSRRNQQLPTVEVHSVRMAQRRSPRGGIVSDLVVEILQRRRGYFDPAVQRLRDANGPKSDKDKGDFRFRAGCTVLIDPVTMGIRRVIRTSGTIKDDDALERVRRFLIGGDVEPHDSFWLPQASLKEREPFAMLHKHSRG